MNNKLKHRLNPMIAALFPDRKWKTKTHHILSPCAKAWGQLQVFSECLFEEPFVLERESWAPFWTLFFHVKTGMQIPPYRFLDNTYSLKTAWIVNRQYLRITLLTCSNFFLCNNWRWRLSWTWVIFNLNSFSFNRLYHPKYWVRDRHSSL